LDAITLTLAAIDRGILEEDPTADAKIGYNATCRNQKAKFRIRFGGLILRSGSGGFAEDG